MSSRLSKSVSSYVIAGLILFLLGATCGFYLTFPNTALQQRLIHEVEVNFPVQLDLTQATLQPLATLSGQEVTIDLSDHPGIQFFLDQIQLQPGWLNTLTGDPEIQVEAHSGDGELLVNWQKSGPLQMIGSGFPLEVPFSANPSIALLGTLTSGQVTTAMPLQSSTASRADLIFDQLSIKGLDLLLPTIPASLQLNKLSLKITGQGTSFTIDQLESSDGDLEVSGQGSLLLATENPQNSRINLSFLIRAGNQADPGLANILKIIGTTHKNGGRKLKLTGTLANPIIR